MAKTTSEVGMSIFSWLAGGSGAANKVVDGIVKTGDALFFTGEEKSEFDMKRQELWLELQKTLANESSPRSRNRRFVAWAVIIMTAIQTFLCIALVAAGKDAMAEDVVSFGVQLKWDWAFCAVIIFYFGTHMIGALRK